MSDVPPSPDVQYTANIDPGQMPDRSETVPEPPMFPARSHAPPPTTFPPRPLWPDPPAPSQPEPVQPHQAPLFPPAPPIHPGHDPAVVRLEGLTGRPSGPAADSADGDGDGMVAWAAGTSLLSLDDAERASDAAVRATDRTALSSRLVIGLDQAQTLYRRPIVVAGLLLLVLFIVGAIGFSRSWWSSGPGVAVDAAGSGAGQQGRPVSATVDGIGPAVASDSTGGDAGNRGAMAGPGPVRPGARPAATAEDKPDGEPPTTTTITGPDSSRTVGTSGPGWPCPVGLPGDHCSTTIPDPSGPTTSLVEVTTSTTRIRVVSSSVPTTRPSTTTSRPTTTVPTTTTTRPTTSTPPTTTTTTTGPTTTILEPTTEPTTTTVTTTTDGPTTSEAQTTTTGPSESRGTGPTVGLCQDSDATSTTPTTNCRREP